MTIKGPAAGLMRQMQDNVKKMQDDIAKLEVTGESGAGMVKVTLTGKYQARKVEISADAMGEDKEFLEDLIAAAINDASQKIETQLASQQQKLMGGMNLGALGLPPGLF